MIEICNSVIRHISFIIVINVTTIDIINHSCHVYFLLKVVIIRVVPSILLQPQVVRVARHISSSYHLIVILYLFRLNRSILINLLQMTVQLNRIVVNLRSLSSLRLIIHHLSWCISSRRITTVGWDYSHW